MAIREGIYSSVSGFELEIREITLEDGIYNVTCLEDEVGWVDEAESIQHRIDAGELSFVRDLQRKGESQP